MDQPVSFNYEHGALHTPTRDALLPSPTTAQPKSEYLRQKLRERREDLGMTDDSLRQLSLSEPKPVRGMDDYIFESEEDHKKNRRRQRGQASRVSSAASQYAGGNPSRSQSYSMGSREQQTSMDKMSKDNFDLKLRLTLVEERGHRLETELEEALEKIDTLQAIEEERDELHEENAVLCDRVEELQQSNDACEQKLRDSWRMNGEVFAELEKRDVAIKEALDMYLESERRMQSLEAELAKYKASPRRCDSSYFSAGTESAVARSNEEFSRPPTLDSEHPEGSVLNDDNKDTRSDMTQFEDEDLTTPTASEAPTIPTEYRPGQYPQWPGTGGKYGFGRDLFFNGDGLDDVPRGRR
ncbi:Spindle associated protein [Neofusicoccum parvum]|nr:Spindle associated protein [Neofusicoccum parvum]